MSSTTPPSPFGLGQKVKLTKQTGPEHAGAIGRVVAIYLRKTGFVFSVELECGDVIRQLRPEEIEHL